MTAEQTPEDGTWTKTHNPENGCGLDWELWLDRDDEYGNPDDTWLGSFVIEETIDRIIRDHAAAAALAIAREALERIAFDEETSYLACSASPHCHGIGPYGHAEDCAVGLARNTLRRIDEVGGRIKGNKD